MVIWDWLRQNLFNTWYNSIISVLIVALLFQLLSTFLGWLLTTQGWVAVLKNLRLLFVGRYPADQVWRIELVVAMIALLVGLSGGVWKGIVRNLATGFGLILSVLGLLAFTFPNDGLNPFITPPIFLLGSAALVALGVWGGSRLAEAARIPLLISWVLLYPIAILIIRGGVGLPIVETNLWGGLLLTMILSSSGIILSFPLGVLLALGRRSNLPIIKGFCVAYIELIRGVPLVTVLFMAQLMLPLFLPDQVRIDSVLRAMVAVTLFSAAYLAENVRGGLQSLPRGQTEAARALGLNPVQTTLLITLPQALRAVIPVLVGQFISLFKDTSLVVIVGLIDLLGIARTIYSQAEWKDFTGGVWRETLLVVALIYWIFSFTMSRTSKKIEEKMSVGYR
ncbi:polar amino acid ABC transporter, inner membrane subunit [Oscillochloris trichoides DG-6]|uniref:Polar amino acid ABC transporter, inner membrane subunit n=1 Tax=Oscillochloris trichoides DG-6 TaxID=765420 RepID=E1IEA2_9CHLR|nr:polar amino acid ABC transporter, inner membrane subunit [Oscillochloris trichoides DG-6]